MSNNLYDVAYELEKAIRNSEDFKQLQQLYNEVNNDASAKRMFDNFREVQLMLQQKQMMGEDISDEEVEKAQQSAALIQQHTTISKLMEAEQRMSMVISELSKIMMNPLEELYGNMEQ
ncbi:MULTISPECIES: YlbF family regulator [Bacillaceae]|uniref:YlbF family regulator n=1 Tax=Bacillaceae TaxID=186817 RepID=UPI001BDE1D67|nr:MULTISPECIES: YlbF family regulator [Bacillaceae]MDX8363341.1 YlbF family regulator [Cytobacillus sp. IB215316]MDX8364672.1 YlbF family regulator [Cytobacillus sp. IB215665]